MESVGMLILDHPFWLWLAVAAAFLAVELVTGSGWLLWPAGSAAVVAVASLLVPMSGPVAVAMFGVVAIISTYVGRRFIHGGPATASDVNDPTARLIGHQGEAAAAFVAGDGRVFVDGKEWAAELEGEGAVAAGAKVKVVAVIGGARLRVTAA
jgi:membrane protein implicated in regulation of membrane protease activity